MKIAEGLLLRKQLEQKVAQLQPLKQMGDSGIFKMDVQRVKVSDEIEEARITIPRVTVSDITQTFDHYASELRKLDASIQKANWSYDLDYKEVSAPKIKEETA